MPTILIFIPVLSVLVFVHEFGHFITAKLFGVTVEEFGFGIPPRIWSKRIGETEYSINLLPLGGFVRLEGEDSGKKIGFQAQDPFKKIVILVSGVVGNFMIAWFILVVLFSVGNPAFEAEVTVQEVALDSPAAKAGIISGMTIKKFAGEDLLVAGQLVDKSEQYAGRKVPLVVETPEGKAKTVHLVPRANPPEGQGALGVVISTQGDVVFEKVSWYRAPWRAFRQATYILVQTLRGFFLTLRDFFIEQEVPQGVTGIVGIYQLTGAAASWGLAFLLQFIAILSLNLVIFNLLPIPALDGGRLLFVSIETLLGCDIDPRWKSRINQIGFILLIVLFLAITAKDVAGLF